MASRAGSTRATGDMSVVRTRARDLRVALGRWLIGSAKGSHAEPAEASEEQRADLSPAQAALAHLPNAVMLVAQDGTVVETNPAAQSLFPALVIGQPLSYALRNPDVIDGIGRAFESDAPEEVLFLERVPTERAFAVHMRALQRPRTQKEVLLSFHDVTAGRRLEQMRMDFVANASHELRTPLASVLGFIETLQGPAREDTSARESFLAVMQEQALRMKRLIDDLLSLSRIEQREHLTPTQATDLRAVVQQSVETLRPSAAEHAVDIHFKSPDSALVLLGDADELQRLCENLIENAVKYGESGKRVDVELSAAGQGGAPQIELTVRDYGPGIAADHLHRITERFYRADAAQSRAKGGTGLGLSIVKHIVNRHRGSLSIESRLGEGAVFRVRFPALVETAGTGYLS